MFSRFFRAYPALVLAAFLAPGSAPGQECVPAPVITGQIPRYATGWSGGVAWREGRIYEVTDKLAGILVKDASGGQTLGNISLPWGDIKDIAYDRWRDCFWVKPGEGIQRVYRVSLSGEVLGSFDHSAINRYIFGLYCDPDIPDVMWMASHVEPRLYKVLLPNGEVQRTIALDFQARGVVRVSDYFWCTYGGETGDPGLLIKTDGSGEKLCVFQLPSGQYCHDAGGMGLDSSGCLWVHGGKDTAIYRIFPGAAPTPGPLSLPSANDSGDFDGDGTSDAAIFRPATGFWAVRSVSRFYFGGSGDRPVCADYDGDGTTEAAVFRPATGLWSVRGLGQAYYGASGDIPVPGDYNGDGTCVPAVFRPGAARWLIRGESRFYYGASGDEPVSDYYYGSGEKLPAVFRPASGRWLVRGLTSCYFGAADDLPLPLFGGGRRSRRPAIFRPGNAFWAARDGVSGYFGAAGDEPVPANYDGRPGAVHAAVFRRGLWRIYSLSGFYFGRSGDVPVTGGLCR